MNDDKTAKDYNIEGGSVLHLVGGTNPLVLLMEYDTFITALILVKVLCCMIVFQSSF